MDEPQEKDERQHNVKLIRAEVGRMIEAVIDAAIAGHGGTVQTRRSQIEQMRLKLIPPDEGNARGFEKHAEVNNMRFRVQNKVQLLKAAMARKDARAVFLLRREVREMEEKMSGCFD